VIQAERDYGKLIAIEGRPRRALTMPNSIELKENLAADAA
jgi:hypothetical protein